MSRTRPLYSGPQRRDADTIITLLTDRIDKVGAQAVDTSSQLSQHITECAATQKKVLAVGCLIFGWLVAHSPEASKLAGVLVKIVAP